jgi:hypothetical protein
MKSFDRLQINFKPSLETYNLISKILGIKPTDSVDSKLSEIPNSWEYEVIDKEEDKYYDFINEFLDILETKYEKLAALGIERKDITFWYLYEYDQQCNMEFDPVRLKRLGDNGICLCISCWGTGGN